MLDIVDRCGPAETRQSTSISQALELLEGLGRIAVLDADPMLGLARYSRRALPLLGNVEGGMVLVNSKLPSLLPLSEVARFRDQIDSAGDTALLTAYQPRLHPYHYLVFGADGVRSHLLQLDSRIRGFRQRHRKVLSWWPVLTWFPDARYASTMLSARQLTPFEVPAPPLHLSFPTASRGAAPMQCFGEPVRERQTLPSKSGPAGMEFVRIEAGRLPAAPLRPCGGTGEIAVEEAFWMQTTTVTNRQWAWAMDEAPLGERHPDAPKTCVDFFEVLEFIDRLNARGEGTFRLPRGHEWELGCRAGCESDFTLGSVECAGDYAWHRGNSDGTPHPVGEKKPNAWGLYDMLGNTKEYCLDRYMPGADVRETGILPGALRPGTPVQLRGAGFNARPDQLRASYITCTPASDFAPNPNIGFRLVLSSGKRNGQ